MTIRPVNGRRWILASASPRRRELLRGIGLDLHIDPSGAPEPERRPSESAPAYAMRMARMKVAAVAPKHRSGIVVGADTIVVAGGRILGKPASGEEARRMLGRLQGRWHEVITGVAVRDLASGRSGSTHSLSRVHFRRLSPAEIEWYLSTGEHEDKAGAYGIQGYAGFFIDRIEGCYFNIVGFPLAAFAVLCRRLGIPLLNLPSQKQKT